MRVDKVDLAIIRALSKDGRRSFANIASEIGLSTSTVQQRANNLIKKGLLSIKGVVHPVDLSDVVIAMIAIKADGTKLRQIAQHLGEFEEVRWVVICAGQFDILIEVVCHDEGTLLSFISDKLSPIEGLRDTVTFPYLQITKRTSDWTLPEI